MRWTFVSSFEIANCILETLNKYRLACFPFYFCFIIINKVKLKIHWEWSLGRIKKTFGNRIFMNLTYYAIKDILDVKITMDCFPAVSQFRRVKQKLFECLFAKKFLSMVPVLGVTWNQNTSQWTKYIKENKARRAQLESSTFSVANWVANGIRQLGDTLASACGAQQSEICSFCVWTNAHIT